jgi:cytochrome P450 family 142 subfamily A polypeptide 1
MMQPNLLDRDFYAGDPHPTFAWMRAHSPVYRDPQSGLWGLFLHEDIIWAERHREIFSNAPGSRPRNGPQPSMIDSDDPIHIRRRHIVDKGFAMSRVAAYEDWIRSIVTELIDVIEQAGRCDVVTDLAAPLPTAVIADLLGVKKEDRARLQRWSDEMISGADGPQNVTETVLKAAADYYTYMSEVLDDRRARPREDLISVLVHAQIDGLGLSPEELMGESLLLLVGGNETTRNAISGGLEALLQDRGQWEMLLDDPGKIAGAVEECLRWATPVINMARTTTQDVEVRGHTIPKGDQVLLLYTSGNRDENVFEQPDRFDVSRDPNPHITFGYGTHYCLGASLARVEIRVMLQELVRRLPGIRLADPPEPLRRTHSSFIRGLLSLPVTFDGG